METEDYVSEYDAECVNSITENFTEWASEEYARNKLEAIVREGQVDYSNCEEMTKWYKDILASRARTYSEDTSCIKDYQYFLSHLTSEYATTENCTYCIRYVNDLCMPGFSA